MNESELVNCGLSNKEIAEIRNIFKIHSNVIKAILYGSRAKGDYRAASDIDITLQGEQLDYAELVAIDNELDDLLLPYTIDLSLYHHIENPDLIEHIKRVGKAFYLQGKKGDG